MADDAAQSPTELAALRAAAAQAAAEAAEAKARAAQAALEAAEAAAREGAATSGTAPSADADAPAEEAAPTGTAPSADADAPAEGAAPSGAGPIEGYAAEVAAGYAYRGGTLALGALLEGEPGADPTPRADVQVGLPLSMLNRHGLVAGATGTGKTKTLQGMAEGLSAAGVPVFLADVKGDLSGLAVPGESNEKIVERSASIGQDWSPTTFPVEFYSLGGLGVGVPIRTTVTDFGPLLLSKVLGLNETQESSLGLIFHWADSQGLALLDLKDLQSTIAYLTSDEGKAELKGIGGVSSATAGVILREIVALQAQGADVFFGEPAFATSDLLRTAPDGRGVISALELPAVQDRPALFSTFLMWLLADLFQELPEVGDAEKPRLVFFFDEAHLLFTGASKEFLQQVVQTVRLVRSKGVGVFFVTQSPKDVPADVLAQLGNRVQHALRAFTPDDAAALRAAVRTYPTSPYDLERLLQSLGTGEAVVTVLTEKGAPTPVAWTRVRAPQSSMEPAPAAVLDGVVAASPGFARFGTAVDNESAFELLQVRVQEQAAARAAAEAAEVEAAAQEKAAKEAAQEAERAAKKEQAELEKMRAKLERDAAKPRSGSSGSSRSSSPLDSFLRSAGTQLGRELTRTIFGTRRR
ncbi:DNA helicase HerA-like ATPase [Cellulosimicrobium cellulans]|uniref:helicase HerA-like domain-containing protein n=1 Tax=Cellulosimicrobium cellulans TaxID=1710 RepID=UPI0019561678|nr:helicase HerA-like domain-containing protein [Cellulosimicrobium cellulans]MBM7820459.1 DNA helicase HerA-like ATPase [Cellulosimicrobium cellulans]